MLITRTLSIILMLVLASCAPPPVDDASSMSDGVSTAAEDASCVVIFLGYWNGNCRGVPEAVAQTLAQKVNIGGTP